MTADLNDAQRRAATLGIERGLASLPPPLLVIAGAGSGKTLTLAARVAELVVAGADPSRILLLTFSRRAAQEMERRVGRVLRDALGLDPTAAPPRLAWCGTFHSVAARLLRLHAAAIGLDPAFTVDDRADSEDLMHLLRHRLGLGTSGSRFPQKGTCLSIYSRVVNARRPLDEVLADAFPWCLERRDDLRRLFAAYAEEKAGQRVLDFDDLLAWWAEAMAEPALGERIRARFDHVLVDEYQDTNAVQAEIVFALRPDGRGLTVVGDDAQSIYSFRGAEVRNILDFAGRFDPPAEVVALERNYRSTSPLLAASNAVIAAAAERHAKTMVGERAGGRPQLVWAEDEAAEARWVAERVLELRERGLSLRSQAVLFRSGPHSAVLELELARRDIPFVKYGGLRFLDAAHVKDVLAVLRFAANPHGQRAGLRALQLVPGIGPAHAARVLALIAGDGAAPPSAEGRACAGLAAGPANRSDPRDGSAPESASGPDLRAGTAPESPDRGEPRAGRTPGSANERDPLAALAAFAPAGEAAAPWAEFVALLAQLRSPSSPWPGELAAVERWYRPLLERAHDDSTTRAADVAQLVRIGHGYVSRERFLTELALDPPAATSDEAGAPGRDEDYLILSTIHSAKGQEWSAVSVLRVVDGCLPSDMSTGRPAEIEEERRLLYVAMTRARQHLHLLVPQRFHVSQQSAYGDRHVYATVSRFLPPALHALFDDVRPACPAAAEAQTTAPPAAPIDLGARVRRAWG